jgi:hypothetical protein
MLPVRIEGCTRVLGAPVGWSLEDSGPCCGLAIRDEVENDLRYMTSAWEPTPDDLAVIAAGGRIMLRIVGDAHPPVAMWVDSLPEEPTP